MACCTGTSGCSCRQAKRRWRATSGSCSCRCSQPSARQPAKIVRASSRWPESASIHGASLSARTRSACVSAASRCRVATSSSSLCTASTRSLTARSSTPRGSRLRRASICAASASPRNVATPATLSASSSASTVAVSGASAVPAVAVLAEAALAGSTTQSCAVATATGASGEAATAWIASALASNGPMARRRRMGGSLSPERERRCVQAPRALATPRPSVRQPTRAAPRDASIYGVCLRRSPSRVHRVGTPPRSLGEGISVPHLTSPTN